MRHLIMAILTICASQLYSQERMNKLSVNPIQLIGYNRLNMEFERGFKEGKFGIGFYMGQTGNASRKIHGEYSQLSEQNASIKFYTRNFEQSCLWFGGLISVSSGTIYSENKLDSATNIGALGILGSFGYQFLIKNFYVNPYANFGYAITNDLFGSAKYTGNIGQPTDFLLTYGLKIGFNF